jgi:alpha-methylacyl-CoA racemase
LDERLLDGVRVMDFGRFLPSAIATTELARHGADIIKVEVGPFGEPFRVEPPLVDGVGDMFLQSNRNKRSVGLDLSGPHARSIVTALVRSASVVVVSARPNSLTRLGLDYESVRAANPRVVHCSITGFGSTGPYAALPAHGLSGDAAAGMLSHAVNDDASWAQPYVVAGPRAAGLYAASAILAALWRAEVTGEGAQLEVAQHDAALAWGFRGAVLAANGAGDFPRYGDKGFRMRAYETQDRRWVLFSAIEPALWRRFCDAIGQADLAGTPTPAGTVDWFPHDRDIEARLSSVFKARSQAGWMQLAQAHALPVTPFVSPDELPRDPHVVERSLLEDVELPDGRVVQAVRHPVRVDGQQWDASWMHEFAVDTVDVLREIGYSSEHIGSLIESGAIVGACPEERT